MPPQDGSMTDRRSFGGLGWVARVLGFMVMIVVLIRLLDRGVISWGQFAVGGVVVFIAAMVLGQLVVVPWLARRESKHPRIATTDAWESVLPPGEALERLRAELEDLDAEFHVDGSVLEVVIGSDVTFRRRGTASEIGWQFLPLLVTFHAAASPSGCQITAAARDNLGWYPEPPAAFVADEIAKRNTALIQRARRVTGQ